MLGDGLRRTLHLQSFTPKNRQTWIIIWIHSFYELVLSDSLADFLTVMIYFLFSFQFMLFLIYILQYSNIHYEIIF